MINVQLGNEKFEKINGVIYNMSPSADYRHGLINLNIGRILSNQLKNSLCLTFVENLDWKYDENNDDYVIPDVMLICDKNKIKKGQYLGIPKFIAETLSPSTALKDKNIKKKLYSEKGVEEYWIVEPRSKSIEIYHLYGNEYQLVNYLLFIDDASDSDYNADTVITLKALPHIQFCLAEIFENI